MAYEHPLTGKQAALAGKGVLTCLALRMDTFPRGSCPELASWRSPSIYVAPCNVLLTACTHGAQFDIPMRRRCMCELQALI